MLINTEHGWNLVPEIVADRFSCFSGSLPHQMQAWKRMNSLIWKYLAMVLLLDCCFATGKEAG